MVMVMAEEEKEKIKQHKSRVHRIVSAPAERHEAAEVDVFQG